MRDKLRVISNNLRPKNQEKAKHKQKESMYLTIGFADIEEKLNEDQKVLIDRKRKHIAKLENILQKVDP